MKKLSMIFAMAAVVLTSCLKEENPTTPGVTDKNDFEPSGVLVEKVFTAGTSETKTYIDGEETSNGRLVIKWCADDAINVWDGVANRKFEMVGEPNGNQATFKGMVDANATDFYAVYPYDESFKYTLKSNGDMIFSLDRPAVQYANPEGGLADKAAVAAGKVDENGNIRFENRSALLKFSFVKGMDVTSITLKGNEADDYIAGTLNLKYNASSNFSVGWENNEKKSTMVTLCNEDGSALKTEVDYYMVLPGNKFGQGYTVSVVLADGTTLEKTSDKSIQYYSNAVNKLASKPLSRTMFGLGYYEAYQGGEDIVIGGKVYNKETSSLNASLLTTTSTISANGIYFLDPAEGETITLGTTKVSDIAIIGNNPSKRVTLEHQGFRLNSRAKVASMNIIFPEVAQQYIQEASDGAEYVVYDNCKIIPCTKVLCYNEVSSVQTIGEFIMVNSEYAVPESVARSTAGAFLFNSYMPGSNLTFDNNIFYVDTPDLPTLKFKIQTRTGSTLNSVVLTNNTFVNILCNDGDTGYFKNGLLISNITVKNNLFYAPSMTRNNYVFMNGLQEVATATTENNVCYTNNSTYGLYMFGETSSTPPGAQRNITILSSSPFSDMDHTNGVFVKTSEAAAYGAKR